MNKNNTYLNKLGLGAPPHLEEYLNRVFSLIRNQYKNEIKYVCIFGSVAVGKADEFSDVDVIFIFNSGSLTDTSKKTLISQLTSIESDFNLKTSKETFNNSFFRALLQNTGMFKSFFITNEESWESFKFKDIFNVGAVFYKIAPCNLVSMSVLQKMMLIDVSLMKDVTKLSNATLKIRGIKENSSFGIEWMKAYLTAQLLSLGALFITPFIKDSTKFSIEAIKWTNLSLVQLNYLKNPKGSKQNNIFKNNVLEEKMTSIAKLRKKYRFDPKFNLYSVVSVWKMFNQIKNIQTA